MKSISGLLAPNIINTRKNNKNINNDNTRQELRSESGIQERTRVMSDSLKSMYVTKPALSFGRNLKEGRDNHLNYLGAHYLGDNKTVFRVYAKDKDAVNVQVLKGKTDARFDADVQEDARTVNMKPVGGNVYEAVVDDTTPGDMYRFQLIKDGEVSQRKDPRTFWQPNDTLGWSAIYDMEKYKWNDHDWMKNPQSGKIRHSGNADGLNAPSDMYIQEMQFDILGGYDKAKKEIDVIAKEGIFNTVLVMPTGEFYGNFNIGYDESDKFAPESSRGTPDDFKSFVDYCHKKNINVVLDVVPNHFGPTGTIVQDYGKAFDEHIDTGWGAALNFESEGQEYMRNYMVDMMMNWIANYHVDGLRVDATEKLFSDSTLKLMAAEIRNHPETRDAVIIPEHINKTKKLTSIPLSESEYADPLKTFEASRQNPDLLKNMGFDLQYIYDFKNTLAGIATGWRIYDCPASIKDLEQEYKQGYRFYQDYPELPNPPAKANLVYHTAHDELNAFGGVRFLPRVLAIKLGIVKDTALDSPDGLDKKPFRKTLEYIKSYLQGDFKALEKDGISKEQFEKAYKEAQSVNRLAIAAVFMHPGQKMLFAGDQRGELAPFNYNADVPDDFICGGNEPGIAGRKLKDVLRDQKGYEMGEPANNQSKLNQPEFTDPVLKAQTLKFTQKLKQLCADNPALHNLSFDKLSTCAYEDEKVLQIHRFEEGNEILAVFNFSDKPMENFQLDKKPDGEWKEILNSNASAYGGDDTNLNNKPVSFSESGIALPKFSVAVFKKIK